MTHCLSDINNDNEIEGITILIGADYYWKIVTGETERLSESLTAVNSKLGWTLHGVSDFTECEFYSSFNVLFTNAFHETEPTDVKLFWDLETIGINLVDKSETNFTDNFIRNNIRFNEDNRYEVSLPWNSDQPLDTNLGNAQLRLRKLVSKLCNNGRLKEYNSVIQEFIDNHFAEKVAEISTGNRTYYLPHRPVYREDKDTTKVRAVFDASSSSPGLPSLNSLLHTGDNLVPNLVNILLNFRFGKYGLIADLEKAFLQISVAKEDRDCLRFLWFQEGVCENLKSLNELPHPQIYRMTRVTFGVTTSPFLLAATLRKHLSSQSEPFKEISGKLLKHFYVDDLVISVDDTNEVEEIFFKSCQILAAANMNLRKWCTNEPEMMEFFLKNATGVKDTMFKKVLGLNWYVTSDELMVDVSSIVRQDETRLLTKRYVFHVISRIFDPLGILTPFTIRAKVLMQDIWKRNVNWDDVLSEDLAKKWRQWSSELPILSTFTIPRCVLQDSKNEIELHVFCDASPSAYGAVAYVKCLATNQVNLLFTKNRVSPLRKDGEKSLTLPKLELTAAVCACRLSKFIVENTPLNIRCVFLWSDSMITLHWINCKASKLQPYVKNRVMEIQASAIGIWNYCPGRDNPADLLTRGVSAAILKESGLWLHGPEWLQMEKEYWPETKYYYSSNESDVLSLIVPDIAVNERKMDPIFPLSKYSQLNKALRITAYVKRFIQNLKDQNKIKGALTAEEMNNAEAYWIQVTQQQEYPSEIESINRVGKVNKLSSLLSLDPIIGEDQLLRLGGRLEEALLPYDVRHPIILPKNSEFTDKVIWQAHEKVSHFGVNATLATLRTKYWIVKGRQKIKSLIGKCVKCKRLKSRPGREVFAPLPRNRLIEGRPFKVVGVDFAGPLYRHGSQVAKEKSYIMLFTCAVVRAVHLELVPDLSTESCLRGLRRFIARRGVPEIIYSDNAKTFKRSAIEINKLFDILQSDEVQELATTHRIKWHFIVERAAWWGGFWERLVRTVKDALKITLGRTCINGDELQTVLTEVEATVNSRPLTYIEEDPENISILTPSSFLVGNYDLGFPMDTEPSKLNRNCIITLWKRREQLLKRFWRRWRTDYLQQLRSAHHLKTTDASRFKVGDVVILQEPNLPRLSWKLGRIVNLLPGRDGKVRACEVELANKIRLRRPVQLLHPLEVGDAVNAPGEDVKNI